MNVIDTDIPEVKIIEPRVFSDERGYFYESFNQKEFSKKVKDITFVQDNQSCSKCGTVRGLHWQCPPYAQSKLVRVVKGSVYDVALDIRKGSPTFMKYVGVLLTAENHKQFFIPRGFAHGFIALDNDTIFQYKCDNLYNKESEGAIKWDSVEGIWDNKEVNHVLEKYNVLLSPKDFTNPTPATVNQAKLFNYNEDLYA